MPQPGRSREGLARGPSEKATNSAVIHRKRCSALNGLKRRPLESLLSPPDAVRPRGCPPPDPGHKGVPPLWNPDQRTPSLGTGRRGKFPLTPPRPLRPKRPAGWLGNPTRPRHFPALFRPPAGAHPGFRETPRSPDSPALRAADPTPDCRVQHWAPALQPLVS